MLLPVVLIVSNIHRISLEYEFEFSTFGLIFELSIEFITEFYKAREFYWVSGF